MDNEAMSAISTLVGNGVLSSVLLWLLVDERKELKKAREAHLDDLRKAIRDEVEIDRDK